MTVVAQADQKGRGTSLTEQPRRKRHRGFWVLVFVAVSLLCAFFHESLLSGLAAMLVRDTSVDVSDVILVHSGDKHLEHAAKRLADADCRKVLLFEGSPTRLTFLGVLSRTHEAGRRRLISCGVPQERIEVIEGQAGGFWQQARLLNAWLADHPGQRVLVYVDSFASRELDYVFRRVIEPSRYRCVALAPLEDRRFNTGTWWKSRIGIKAFFSAVLRLAFQRVCGEETIPAANPDPAAYEARLVLGAR